MATRVLTGPRWSSAVQCSRRAVYEGLGIAGEPFSAETLGYFRRGRLLGETFARDINDQLVEQGRPEALLELEVPWPNPETIGTGHADLFIPDEGRIVEIVSSADCDLPAHKPVQAAGYALNWPDAKAATVLAIDPSSLRDQAFPVDLLGLQDEVHEIEQEVLRGLRDGELPERPEGIESPSQRPCFDCPFRRECWKTWEPWPVGTLPESLNGDLLRLADLEDQISRAKKVEHLTDERDEIRGKLRGLMVEGGQYRGGGVQVKWTEVAPRRTFRLADYEKTGHTLPPAEQEFVKESGGYDRWTVKRVEQ